ncbi:MAG: hypothetical protein QGG65_00620 [Gammaproteobacteria bacterium]|nr:hypothetical protein [Gammaproteobacteria bacterium]HJP03506.1 hypothetical protein [Gammaproteobacteria bacterium]
MSRQAQYLGIWAICSFIAALVALQLTSASYAEGTWVPAGNDSFYHARRILDAAESPGGLYQFDKSIHVPEGSWLTWPWAYDWGMAKALQGVKVLSPATDSMAFLTHVPVYWVFVNMALLVGILVVLRLPWHWSALVGVGYAVSPLTQLLHGVGIIDHHFMEHSFVLLTLLTALRWLKGPGSVSRAALLGVTLGIAPAFHTGLFILQVPVLFCLFILWLRDQSPPREAVLALATALVLATAAALLPSEPFREGQFQFSVLSWFHLYIAAISTLLISCFARFSFSPVKLVTLAVVGIALLIPIWGETIGGAAFLTRNISLLDRVMEARSPIQMLTDKGLWEAISYYSPIGLLAPLLIPVYIYRGWQARDATQLFLSVMVVFGVALLLMQFRLHYFGSFALILGWVLLANEKLSVTNRRPLLTFGIGLLILAIAFQPAAQSKLFTKYALGLDPGYQDVYTLFAPLTERCQDNPGIALADNNFGHYIRFHTECTVIANNFLMTPQHEEKIAEMEYLLELSPEELLEEAPENTRYVFARMLKFYGIRDGEAALTSTEYVKENTPRLYFELNSRDDLPDRFRVVGELPLDPGRGLTRARVVEILPAVE